MKNTQKGFVKALLLIIITLLIVGGGFYFVFYKKTITIQINPLDSNEFNSYTSSTGLFSLKYPATWIPSLSHFYNFEGFTAIIPSSNGNSLIAFIATPDIDGASFNSLGGNKTLLKTNESFGKIDGYLTDIYTSNQGEKIYVINIGQYEKTPVSIIAGIKLSSQNSNLTELEHSKILSEAESVVRSITINKNKIRGSAQIMKNQIDNARIKGKDALIKSNLSNMRATAELYYDNNKDSYSGFCKSKDLKGKKEIENITQTSLICRDGDQDYVFSSALIDGGFWCVDSSGISTNTKAMDTKNACLRQEKESSTTPPPPRLP